ncbi:hypothetical protein A2Y99_04420 [Candidatus Gottesmanbacteria bacterium RBG_13_37_7]|uniref:Cache domain-containing protein n=1 Tax=Candidatus Gottesmanbacteria bacterium RBG_13_37_7 TaxID=1798369 RepID=A0A1F5YHQ2_9BACT|nr:MAG: hypothetical protein A2Y99_04420 [Candidatus Gottesmanbacteria bacterium RBG_13_37_7]
MIFDKDGQIITGTLNTLPEQEENLNIRDRSYFKKAIETGKYVIGNPIKGRINQSYVIPLVQPIIKDNKVEGIVVVSFLVDQLKKRIEETLSSTDKTTIVLDSEGNIVFTANQPLPDDDAKKLLANSDCYTAAKTGNLHLIDNKHLPLLQKNVIGASSPVNHLGWVVISIDPIDEVFAPLMKVQNVIWLILFSAVVFALAIISFFLRKVKIIY